MIIVILYFIISIYFGRKNPMYYLILPFALQQGQTAFIDQHIALGGKNLLSTYTTIFVDVVFFLTTFLVIVFLKPRYKYIACTGSVFVNVFLVYLLLIWVISFLLNYKTEEVFLVGRQFFYIPLSYYLWIAVFESVTRKQYEDFLRSLFYITPVLTILYILNSSKLVPMFDESLIFTEINYGTATFLRDFKTIPIWLVPVFVLSFQSVLTPIVKINRNILILNLILLPVGILFTFTRSLLIISMMQMAFLLLFYATKVNGVLIRNLLVCCFFIGVSLVIIHKVFPQQSTYFSERLISAKSEGKDEENVDIRFQYLHAAIRIVNETSPAFGPGLNKKYHPRMEAIGSWIPDSTIPYFLVSTGWTGVLLLFSIMLAFFLDSLMYFLKSKDWLVGYLCSYFLTLFIASFMMGTEGIFGTVWTLMNFSLYAVIRFNKWLQLT